MRSTIVGVGFAALLILAARTAVLSGDKDANGTDSVGTSETSAGVSVQVDSTSYARGDTAIVTIVNRAPSPILFAFICDGFVDGLVKREWQPVYVPDCTRIRVYPTRLAPGEGAMLPLILEQVIPADPSECAAYRVRLRFQFEDSTGYGETHSRPFAVTH
jgi:hypothetical protein